jgi:antitoxin component of RelBE/YafQ-DinJ toxin-antitoxin module
MRKIVSIRMEDTVYEELRSLCRGTGLTMGEAIEDLLRRDMERELRRSEYYMRKAKKKAEEAMLGESEGMEDSSK